MRRAPVQISPYSFKDHSRAEGTLISQEPKGTAAVITNGRGDYLLHLRDKIPGIL